MNAALDEPLPRKKSPMKNLLCKLLLLSFAAAGMGGAVGADYPVRPVKIVLPYAAGGGADGLTRLLATRMAARWKQAVVVENRPGAGATLGTAMAAQSPPDGYTLLMTAGTMTVSPAMYPKLPYDVVKDFAPITLIANSPFVLTTRADLGVNSVEELLAMARAKPGKLNYGSPGVGTLSHLTGELLKFQTGVDMVHVPYKGGVPAIADMLAGRVDFLFDTPAAVLPHVTSGKFKAIAVTTSDRTPVLPNVPTIAESGVKGFDVRLWFGLLAPANTPEAVIKEVRDAALAALAEDEMARNLALQGLVAQSSTPAAFEQLIKSELSVWAPIVKRANIKSE